MSSPSTAALADVQEILHGAHTVVRVIRCLSVGLLSSYRSDKCFVFVDLFIQQFYFY